MQIVWAILAPLLAILTVIAFYVGYPDAFKSVASYFKDPVALFTFILALCTALLALATFRLALLTEETVKDTKESLKLSQQANERTARLFIGQNRPLIDVTPIAIRQVHVSDDTQVVTFFSIANYSGFSAFDIAIDLKYGGYSWILEWRKARTDRDGKGKATGVELDKIYSLPPNPQISELAAGDRTEFPSQGSLQGISGSLSLEPLCNSADGLPVWVRITWRNENRHIFDEIHKFTLRCTTDGKTGRAFTMIPEGVTSQKGRGISGQSD